MAGSTHHGSPYTVIGPRVYPGNAFEPFDSADVDGSIVQRFEKQVARHCDRKAVCTFQLQLTYRQLNWAANQIARLLLDRLGENETSVGVFMEHGTSIIAAILASSTRTVSAS